VGWRNSPLDVFVLAILEEVEVGQHLCLEQILGY
jgi:hypothetical protein